MFHIARAPTTPCCAVHQAYLPANLLKSDLWHIHILYNESSHAWVAHSRDSIRCLYTPALQTRRRDGPWVHIVQTDNTVRSRSPNSRFAAAIQLAGGLFLSQCQRLNFEKNSTDWGSCFARGTVSSPRQSLHVPHTYCK